MQNITIIPHTLFTAIKVILCLLGGEHTKGNKSLPRGPPGNEPPLAGKERLSTADKTLRKYNGHRANYASYCLLLSSSLRRQVHSRKKFTTYIALKRIFNVCPAQSFQSYLLMTAFLTVSKLLLGCLFAVIF